MFINSLWSVIVKNVSKVATHEFGHAMGLSDNGMTYTIMNNYT